MFRIYFYFRTTWIFSDYENDICKRDKTDYSQFMFRYSHIRYYNFPPISPQGQNMTTVAQTMDSRKNLSLFSGPEKSQRVNKIYHNFFKHYNCFLVEDFPVKELCILVRITVIYKNIFLLKKRTMLVCSPGGPYLT